MQKAKILIIDADQAWMGKLSGVLLQDNFEVFTAISAQDAGLLLDVNTFDLTIADVNFEGRDGTAYFEQLRQLHPEAGILVCTATATIPQAVHFTRLGAVDYCEKNGDLPAFREKIQQSLQRQRSPAGPTPKRETKAHASSHGFYGIVSQNARMRDIFELIQTIADSTANVLVQGETGTGKELVACAIHQASFRHDKPFVTLDCGALSRELLESELFGHEKGAFTGAVDRHIGRFERANGGTLFLDEVANIDMAVQAKLLRVLQSRVFDRVGGQKPIAVDVRIIAATNRLLEDLVRGGQFREDLYHRLNVVQIDLPALRERVEDIPLLAIEFLRRFVKQNDREIRGFTPAASAALNSYPWPGNIRELENVILQAVVLTKSAMIDLPDLPKRIIQPVVMPPLNGPLSDQLGEPEKQIIVNALRQHSGNIKRAAEMLDISRTTLYAKLRKYQIDPDTIR